MSKIKTTFYCKECGSQYSKWQGQCNKCQEWNSIEEEILNTSKRNKEGSYNSINNLLLNFVVSIFCTSAYSMSIEKRY